MMKLNINACSSIAEELGEIGAKRILLLGTKTMMTSEPMSEFFASRGIEVMAVDDCPDEVDEINRVIQELRHGIITLESKEFLVNFVYQFPADSEARPDAVVLGCAKLGLILGPEDVDIPIIV